MDIQTRYRVFRIMRTASAHREIFNHVLEGCGPEEFATENEARDWLCVHGDHRNAQHEYVILPCMKLVR